MRLPPRTLRHVSAHRWAFSAVAITALITSVFTAAAVAFLSAASVISIRAELADSPASEIAILSPLTGASVRQASADVASAIEGPRGPGQLTSLRATIVSSFQSGTMTLIGSRGLGCRWFQGSGWPCWPCWACWPDSARCGRRLERRDHGRASDRGGSRGRARARNAVIKDQCMIMEPHAGDRLAATPPGPGPPGRHP
jgi:hypothetical protein